MSAFLKASRHVVGVCSVNLMMSEHVQTQLASGGIHIMSSASADKDLYGIPLAAEAWNYHALFLDWQSFVRKRWFVLTIDAQNRWNSDQSKVCSDKGNWKRYIPSACENWRTVPGPGCAGTDWNVCDRPCVTASVTDNGQSR